MEDGGLQGMAAVFHDSIGRWKFCCEPGLSRSGVMGPPVEGEGGVMVSLAPPSLTGLWLMTQRCAWVGHGNQSVIANYLPATRKGHRPQFKFAVRAGAGGVAEP